MKDEAPSSFEEPVAERLIIVAAPDFETSIQASEMLLIYISKQLTNETEQISVDSLEKVFSLIKKVKENRKTIYEGILMLFCKAKLNDLPELKAAIEGQISSMKVEEIASSRVLTTLVCKLLLKLKPRRMKKTQQRKRKRRKRKSWPRIRLIRRRKRERKLRIRSRKRARRPKKTRKKIRRMLMRLPRRRLLTEIAHCQRMASIIICIGTTSIK